MFGLFGGKPEFLKDGDIFSRLRDAVTKASNEITIVSAFVEPSDDLKRQLVQAARRGVEIQIWFRRDKEGEYRGTKWFTELADAGISFQSIERLHAKIFVIDDVVFVGSMNLTESSWNNSREFAVSFPADKNEYFLPIKEYLDQLNEDAQEVGPARKQGSKSRWGKRRNKPAATATGHCIRCNEDLPFNPKKPYCADDYAKWAEYENPEYKDKYCHGCGSKHGATMAKPLCSTCYQSRAV